MINGRAGCGLQYAVRKSGRAVAYCALSIHCGTRDEEGFHSGIAHFTEHTIFKGTEHKSATVINSYLDRLGGELNAFTTKEEIVLHATVLKEDLPKAAALLLELATSPTFPEKEIETEKGVVIDEIQSYKDSPADDVYDRFEEMLFAGHPLGGPILGTAASVKKITTEELVRFVKKHFTAGRMALTMVAPQEEKAMEKLVLKLAERFFPGETMAQEAKSSTEEELTTKLEETFGRLRGNHFDKTLDKRNHEVNAVLGGLAPSLYEEKDRLATVLMANILGGPSSNSLLNSELREKHGWVYGVECSYTQYSDSGILVVSLGCDKDNLEKCLKAVDKAVRSLKEKPLSESKLRSCKKQLLGQLAISSDNGETQCLAMGKSLLSFSHIASDEENKAAIERITASDIQRIASTIFSEERLSRLIFL